MDIKNDLKVDENKLDKEFIHQPILLNECSEELAHRIRERDDLKLELEVLEAELDLKIREEYIGKLTESKIKNMVVMDIKRIAKVRELNAKIEECNLTKGGVNSFEHKKSSLEGLSKLFTSGFYADPREKKRNKVSNAQRGKLNDN